MGTSYNLTPVLAATLSTAAPVGMDLAYPLIPVFLKYGIEFKLAANTANESEGVTKKAFLPSIYKDVKHKFICFYINYFSYQLNILFTIFLSPSPSKAAPKSYGPFFIASTKSLAYVKFGSG